MGGWVDRGESHEPSKPALKGESTDEQEPRVAACLKINVHSEMQVEAGQNIRHAHKPCMKWRRDKP